MDPVDIVKIGLFAKLKGNSLEKLRSIIKEEKFDSGAPVFSEGDSGDKLYLILEGNVRISKIVRGVGEEALAILEQGSWFGEMSLIDEGTRSADARAHAACRLATITREDFRSLLAGDKDLAIEILWAFLRTMSLRLRETNEKIKTFFILSSLF